MNDLKLDILAIAAHPDDVELSASGTLYKHKKQGKTIGILDLTHGELGSRGSAEIRQQEAAAAAQVLELDVREMLSLGDGFFEIHRETLLPIIEQIRRFRPEVVLCNAVSDRHPDHGRGAELASRACFLSGLLRIETHWEGQKQEHWRPKAVYHYIQDRYLEPDFVVDITEEFDRKTESILAYRSQFHHPGAKGPNTPISNPDFLHFIEARARQFGRIINATFGEGFTVERAPGINDITGLI